jgi:uncharacterized protein (TIGR00288 family)
MQEKLNIAVFVDYDNIEIGVKSTLRREFNVGAVLDALKERGVVVAKFAYANWSRQEGATRQMAENAVQMVQRIPSPRGDKNGADINLALDALEMAFTHDHVQGFAIISGDSDFIPLVNKLKEYGKTVYIVGGKAFTSTILQQNCHEFISYESLLDDAPADVQQPRVDRPQQQPRPQGDRPQQQQGDRPQGDRPPNQADRQRDRDKDRGPKQRPAPLELSQAVPLVERALEVLQRRGVQPQLGLLKSTMLQLTPSFNERAFGAHSFSEFVEMLKKGEHIQITGSGGRYLIERKAGSQPEKPLLRPEEALPALRDVLETHRLDMEDGGASAEELQGWFTEEAPHIKWAQYGFQQFTELLNFAQDRTVVRVEPDAERGLWVQLGAEFYPPAPPPKPEGKEEVHPYDERQPHVAGQPSFLEPDPKPAPTTLTRARKKRTIGPRDGNSSAKPQGRKPPPRKRKPE